MSSTLKYIQHNPTYCIPCTRDIANTCSAHRGLNRVSHPSSLANMCSLTSTRSLSLALSHPISLLTQLTPPISLLTQLTPKPDPLPPVRPVPPDL